MKVLDSQLTAHALLESLPDAVLVLSPETTVHFANRAARRLLALGREKDAAPKDFAEAFRLATPGNFARWVAQAKAEDGWQGTLIGETPAGLHLILEGTLTPTGSDHPFPDSVLLTLHDVTQKQRLWELLSESHGRLADLVSLVSEGICIHDGESVLEVNKALTDLLGYQREELLGSNPIGVIAPEYRKTALNMADSNADTIYEAILLHKNGRRLYASLHGKICTYNGKPARAVVVRDISDFKKREAHYRFVSHITEKSSVAIAALDESLHITYVNEQFVSLYGYKREEVLGRSRDILLAHDQNPGDSFLEAIAHDLRTTGVFRGQDERRRKDGTVFPSNSSVTAVHDEEGRLVCYSDVSQDITKQLEKKAENEKLRLQLFQSQKLEAIGQMAAGIAHEINTPNQYIGDNLRFLSEIHRDMTEVEALHRDLVQKTLEGKRDVELAQRIVELEQDKDWDFIMHEMPMAIRQTQEGAERVAEIVRAVKEFSHPGTKDFTDVALNEAIRNTVTVARNEWKYVADVETDLAPDLPVVQGISGELNQMLLNLIINAAHAIEDAVEAGLRQKGVIRIRTRQVGDHVEVRVQDDGCGIPAEIQHRIFDPFFTTKKFGKGTGQGLALTYGIVVKHHQGNIRFTTQINQGTTFIITLPLQSQRDPAETNWGLW